MNQTPRTAPKWLDRVAGMPDTIDTLALLGLTSGGFVAANMPGLLGGFGLFWVVRVARQTPILPATFRFFRNVFAGDKNTLSAIARTVLPAIDDAPAAPQETTRPMAADAAPAGLRATVSVPPPVAAPVPATAPAPIPQAADALLEIAREGRKVKVFVVLTPHSAQVADLGIEGRGENRENFIFVTLPQVTEAEKHLPRVVDVYYGNPHRKGNEPAGRYIVPAPKPVTGEPNFNVQAFMQGVSGTVSGTHAGTVSEGVSGYVLQTGHTFGHTLSFDVRFTKSADITAALVKRLLLEGFGLRKTAAFLPFRAEDARALVEEIRMNLTALPDTPPAAGTNEELALVRYLAQECNAPLKRIAALLHGNTHDNLNRIRSYGL